jgi:hypothetical protein
MKNKIWVQSIFFLETGGIQHANVFIQFPNKELLQMSFERRNTEEDFIPEKTVD